jgi:hypothetical protein
MITRISLVSIRGSADGLQIKGHSDNKYLFIEANWLPQPDIQDHFAMMVMGRQEGRILIREHPSSFLKGEHKIDYDNIPWEAITTPFAEMKSQLGAAVKIAKADKEDKISVTVNDGSVSRSLCRNHAFNASCVARLITA